MQYSRFSKTLSIALIQHPCHDQTWAWAIRTWRCSWQGHIRLDVEYSTALFKYYHGNYPSHGALLCSHKLFKYRHSDTPLINGRMMSWQHYLPLLLICSFLISSSSSVMWPKTQRELDVVFGHSFFCRACRCERKTSCCHDSTSRNLTWTTENLHWLKSHKDKSGSHLASL